ncbi:hypothetical protein DL96DRAFT_1591642 [Flagelloscypha sp. PMI_526]|nr:hypothetical protein DL96DRAFT_1591642 [Flagelloscypha sp. PMI_526]
MASLDHPLGRIKAGFEEVISYPGTSQFQSGGQSACGLAAMNFVRVANELSRRDNWSLDTVLAKLIDHGHSGMFQQSMISICSLWTSTKSPPAPLFATQMSLQPNAIYDRPSLESFASSLSQLRSLAEREGTICGLVFTRPPEITACICIPNRSGKSIFIFFDSHPRADYPNGSGLVANMSERSIAARLQTIYYVDHGKLVFLAQYSGHFFTPRPSVRSFYPFELGVITQASIELLLHTLERDLRKANAELVSLRKLHKTITQTKNSHTPQSRPSTSFIAPPLTSNDPKGKGKARETPLAIALSLQAEGFPDTTIFRCNLCLDDHPQDDIAKIDTCAHSTCRECLTGYINSKIDDRVYPIECPICTADSKRTDQSAIPDEILLMLGIGNPRFEVYQEMQLASLSVLLHCRRCTNTRRAEIVACPLPNCTYVWCKNCQQPVQSDGPRWKRCPGCNTAVQKSDGCNHMTCMVPGCTSHWCYICGDLIIKSTLPTVIRQNVSRHYRRCRLFEDVPG